MRFNSFKEEKKLRAIEQKNNVKLDKKLKELVLQLEDERRYADEYREQLEETKLKLTELHLKGDDGKPGNHEKTQRRKLLQERDSAAGDAGNFKDK